MQDDKV